MSSVAILRRLMSSVAILRRLMSSVAILRAKELRCGNRMHHVSLQAPGSQLCLSLCLSLLSLKACCLQL